MPCLARLFPPISPENLENLAHVRRDTCRLRHHTSLCHPVMELDKISTAIATKKRSAMAEKSGWVGEKSGGGWERGRVRWYATRFGFAFKGFFCLIYVWDSCSVLQSGGNQNRFNVYDNATWADLEQTLCIHTCFCCHADNTTTATCFHNTQPKYRARHAHT